MLNFSVWTKRWTRSFQILDYRSPDPSRSFQILNTISFFFQILPDYPQLPDPKPLPPSLTSQEFVFQGYIERVEVWQKTGPWWGPMEGEKTKAKTVTCKKILHQLSWHSIDFWSWPMGCWEKFGTTNDGDLRDPHRNIGTTGWMLYICHEKTSSEASPCCWIGGFLHDRQRGKGTPFLPKKCLSIFLGFSGFVRFSFSVSTFNSELRNTHFWVQRYLMVCLFGYQNLAFRPPNEISRISMDFVRFPWFHSFWPPAITTCEKSPG